MKGYAKPLHEFIEGHKLGEDICEKQKQYKWGANFMKKLSLDLRAEFPKAEGFSVVNLYYIKRWFVFYSSHTNFFYQAGKKLQDVENSTLPILLVFSWNWVRALRM